MCLIVTIDQALNFLTTEAKVAAKLRNAVSVAIGRVVWTLGVLKLLRELALSQMAQN